MVQPSVKENRIPITALVVEDDPVVRMVARTILEDMGFHVVEAPDGEDGLAILRQDRSVTFVFSDISMPRMDGLTMLARARETRSDLKVLMTSGMSQPPPGEAFIQKPYRAAALKKCVGQMIAL